MPLVFQDFLWQSLLWQHEICWVGKWLPFLEVGSDSFLPGLGWANLSKFLLLSEPRFPNPVKRRGGLDALHGNPLVYWLKWAFLEHVQFKETRTPGVGEGLQCIQRCWPSRSQRAVTVQTSEASPAAWGWGWRFHFSSEGFSLPSVQPQRRREERKGDRFSWHYRWVLPPTHTPVLHERPGPLRSLLPPLDPPSHSQPPIPGIPWWLRW